MEQLTVPHWPIITLTWAEDGTLQADDSMQSTTYRLEEGQDRFDLARAAAVEASLGLGMSRCRVQGIGPDGAVHELVVDAVEEELTEAPAALTAPAGPAVTVQAPTGGRWAQQIPFRYARARRWAGGRKGKRILTAVALVLVLGVTGGVLASKTLAPGVGQPTATRQSAPAAPEGRLPVRAPAGWTTYAAWTVASGNEGVRPVIAPDGTVLTLVEGKLSSLDAENGAVQWSRDIGGRITDMAVMVIGGQDRIVLAEGSSRLRTFGLDGRDELVYDGGATSKAILTGPSPFFTLPDQRALVIDGRALVSRLVPAGAQAYAAKDDELIAADPSNGNLWSLTDDSVNFPDPVVLPAPDGAKALAGIAGFTNGSLVTVWRDGRTAGNLTLATTKVLTGKPSILASITVTSAAAETTALEVDRATGMAVTGRVLIGPDGRLIETASSNGKLGGGYLWSLSKDRNPVRVSPDGKTRTTGAGSPVPLLKLPNGLLLVQAGTQTPAYYALTPEEGETK